MRILLGALRRRGDPHELEHLDRALPGVLPRRPFVDARDLRDLIPHREDRVQRGHRLLEDHGDAIAANLPHLGVGEREQVAPL
jgi:hypothetical protein